MSHHSNPSITPLYISSFLLHLINHTFTLYTSSHLDFSPMASKFIFTSVVILMLLCLLLMNCNSAFECFGANGAGLKDIRNRKLLSALKDKKASLKTSMQGSSSFKYGEKSLSWELRKVPSGPDPLHHNGGNPKKPQTP